MRFRSQSGNSNVSITRTGRARTAIAPIATSAEQARKDEPLNKSVSRSTCLREEIREAHPTEDLSVLSASGEAAEITWIPRKHLGEDGYGQVHLWEKHDGSDPANNHIERRVVKDVVVDDATRNDDPIQARIMRRLNEAGCNTVVQIHDWTYIQEAESRKLRMMFDFCEHGNLGSLIEFYRINEQEFPERFIWHVFFSLTSAVCFCARGSLADGPRQGWVEIVHGDVKPANVLLGATTSNPRTDYPTIKLWNFDHAVETRGPGRKQDVFTQAEPGDISRASSKCDVYAVGRIIVEMLSIAFAKYKPDDYGILWDEECGFQYDFFPYTRDLISLVGEAIEPDPHSRIDVYDLYLRVRQMYTKFHIRAPSLQKCFDTHPLHRELIVYTRGQKHAIDNNDENYEMWKNRSWFAVNDAQMRDFEKYCRATQQLCRGPYHDRLHGERRQFGVGLSRVERNALMREVMLRSPSEIAGAGAFSSSLGVIETKVRLAIYKQMYRLFYYDDVHVWEIADKDLATLQTMASSFPQTLQDFMDASVDKQKSFPEALDHCRRQMEYNDEDALDDDGTRLISRTIASEGILKALRTFGAAQKESSLRTGRHLDGPTESSTSNFPGHHCEVLRSLYGKQIEVDATKRSTWKSTVKTALESFSEVAEYAAELRRSRPAIESEFEPIATERLGGGEDEEVWPKQDVEYLVSQSSQCQRSSLKRKAEMPAEDVLFVSRPLATTPTRSESSISSMEADPKDEDWTPRKRTSKTKTPSSRAKRTPIRDPMTPPTSASTSALTPLAKRKQTLTPTPKRRRIRRRGSRFSTPSTPTSESLSDSSISAIS